MPALVEIKVSRKEPKVQWRYWTVRRHLPWNPLEEKELVLNFNGFTVFLEDGSAWNGSVPAVVKVDYNGKRIHSKVLRQLGTYIVGQHEIKRRG